MNCFYIIANSQKDQNLETTLMIRDYLISKGKVCTYQKEQPVFMEDGYHYTNADLIPEETECVIVLGGDGTLIQAARDLSGRDIPLLGVNLGTLGYLAEVERQNLLPALDSLLDNEYEVEERMMLEGRSQQEEEVTVRDLALNDIVISRDGPLRIINFDITVNGQFLNCYSADGIIISTPTGSTGYSLSAGGPIIEPTASMIVITPICSHALNTRSIVLSGKDEVVIEVGRGRKTKIEEAEAAFDGNRLVKLKTGDKIVVKKAEKKAKIIKMSKVSFLEILRKKINGN